MKEGQIRWTRNELILAINLYCQLPFGKLHKGNPEIIRLAKLIGRTPSSVSFKLVNFASFDPSLSARGIKGASNASKLDKTIWDEFYDHLSEFAYESELLWAQKEKVSIETRIGLENSDIPLAGKMKEKWVKTRVNQHFFRKMVLSSYNQACCITGISQSELLVAGHIMPWALDEKNRMNPRNGLAMNALHDRAFEAGLITITPEYNIKISPQLTKKNTNEFIEKSFLALDNKKIRLPHRFLPDPEFLSYHYYERFRK